METSMVTLSESERAAAEAVFGERLPLAERTCSTWRRPALSVA